VVVVVLVVVVTVVVVVVVVSVLTVVDVCCTLSGPLPATALAVTAPAVTSRRKTAPVKNLCLIVIPLWKSLESRSSSR
jgi:hypothetical protein